MKLYKIRNSKIDNKGLYASCDIKDRTKIIEYKGKPKLPSKRYKWLTLWEIDKLIKHGPIVGPHLRAILSLL